MTNPHNKTWGLGNHKQRSKFEEVNSGYSEGADSGHKTWIFYVQ